MNRFFALILALIFASLTVSSACVAQASDWVGFSLDGSRGNGGRIQANFSQGDDRDHNRWSSTFLPSDLIGLDVPGFRGMGNRPLRFALAREAGRLDCAGDGGGSYAHGGCRFTPDAGFTRLLEARGIARPTREQAFSLMAINVRRQLIEAIAAARYPTPSIGDLVSMTAVGVTGQYVADLGRAGYRPQSISSLVEFKALDITPEWIGGFVRIGYANLPPNELVQLKALAISPEFVAGFDRAGYRHLPPTTLVQLKALDITPDFARRAMQARSAIVPVGELVQLKMTGRVR